MATLGGNVPSLRKPGEFSSEPPKAWCPCGHHRHDHGLSHDDGTHEVRCFGDEDTCTCKAYAGPDAEY